MLQIQIEKLIGSQLFCNQGLFVLITANNYDSEATEDDGSCLFDIIDDEVSPNIGDEEVSLSLPENTMLYGLVAFTVGALITAGLVETCRALV